MPILLALALLMMMPGAAAAATATYETYHQSSSSSKESGWTAGRIEFVAAPGEANRLTITALEGGVEAVDQGAPLTAGPGCTAVDANRVRCEKPSIFDVTVVVTAGDGDDAVTASSIPEQSFSALVAGGDGSDVIDVSGLTGYAQLDGGAGDDRLTGSPANDTLNLSAGRDTIDGGPSIDTLTSVDGTPVAVDLTANTAGRPDGTSTVRGIEAVIGTPGSDRIVGGPGDDELEGGAGDDFIDGGGGDDELRPDDPPPSPITLGRDVVFGGAGNDYVDARGGGDRIDAGEGDDRVDPGYSRLRSPRDRAACGPGRDDVGFTGPAALLRDCEGLAINVGGTNQALELGPRSAAEKWSVGMKLACFEARPKRCPATIVLREASPPGQRPGALIARRRIVLRDGAAPVGIRMRLGARGAALLRERGGRLAVLIHLRLPLDYERWEDAYATVAVGG